MSEMPSSALLVSPFPSPALRLLADALTDVEVAEDASHLSQHHQVILSGAVSSETVAEVAAELTRRPGLHVGVDLAHPPMNASLAPLALFYDGGQKRIGHLPVAAVTTSGEGRFTPQNIDELARFLHAGQPEAADSAALRESLYALATDLAAREQRIRRLEARLRLVEDRRRRTGTKLAEERARVARLKHRLAAARERADAAEQHVLLRMVRAYRRARHRLPGGPWGLLLAGVVGLLTAALVAGLVAGLVRPLAAAVAAVATLMVVGAVVVGALFLVASRHRGSRLSTGTAKPACPPD